VVNGPVIKIYKNGDYDNSMQHLDYMFHMPVLKDKNGSVITP